jgi:iron complex outermembrane recepter protein
MKFGMYAALMASTCALAAPAYADDAATNGGQAASPDFADIIVTAQKRETKLEKTPMTINVVTSSDLRERGIASIEDLNSTVPGLTMNDSPGGLPGISVRGIGTSTSNQLFEQSVGLFVDGVYHPRQRQYKDALFDDEQIEVVKGTQGVLFGKNTSVGAISLASRLPGHESGGYIEAQNELNYGSTTIDGAYDLRTSSAFAVRIASEYDDNKGYVDDRYTNQRVPYGSRYVVRALADWDVTPDLNAVFKLQWGRSTSNGNPFEVLGSTVTPSSAATLAYLGVPSLANYTKYEGPSSANEPALIDHQINFDPSLVLKYHFGNGYSITSTTGYSRYTYQYGFDSDSTPTFILDNQFSERFGQFYQELRLNSPSGKSYDYIVGAIYSNSTDTYGYNNFMNDFPAGEYSYLTGNYVQAFHQKEHSFAAFANLNWTFLPRWKLNLGGRFSSDTKDGAYSRSLVSNFGDGSVCSAEPTSSCNLMNNLAQLWAAQGVDGLNHTDNTFDFSGTISYDISSSATFYASAGQGNKGAAFNNQAGAFQSGPAPFLMPHEVATTFEAGIKGRFLNGLVYGSLAGFIVNVHNYQDAYFDAVNVTFSAQSVGAKSRGFEGEFQTRKLLGPLSAFGNFSWLPEAKYAWSPLATEVGTRLQRAPKFTGTLGIRGKGDIGKDWELSGFADIEHSSNYLHQPLSTPGDFGSGTYDLVNARLELTYRPANVSVFVSAKNLTDAVYRTFAYGWILGSGTVAALNEPRTVTVGARLKF